MMKNFAARTCLLLAVASLGACAQYRPAHEQAPTQSVSRGAITQAEFGVISAIDRIPAEQQVSGGGAVVGGVTGAVVGRQFGGSSQGRAMGTFIGAVAGVLIGNQIETQNHAVRGGGVRVLVQLDGGGQRSFEYAQSGDLRIGERVRVEGNQIVRM